MMKPSMYFIYECISEWEKWMNSFVLRLHCAKLKDLSLDNQGAFLALMGCLKRGVFYSQGVFRGVIRGSWETTKSGNKIFNHILKEYFIHFRTQRTFVGSPGCLFGSELTRRIWADQEDLPRLWSAWLSPPTIQQPQAHLPKYVFSSSAFYPTLDVSGKVLGNIWQAWPSLPLLIPFPHLVDLPDLEESRNFQWIRFCWKFTSWKEKEPNFLPVLCNARPGIIRQQDHRVHR